MLKIERLKGGKIRIRNHQRERERLLFIRVFTTDR